MTEAASPQKKSDDAPRIEPGTWVYDHDLGCLVPKRGRNFFGQNDLRADHLGCPAIRPDGMSRAIKSMADGRVYDGKSAYYKSVQRAGAEIVGHDKNWQSHVRKPGLSERALEAEIAQDVKKAFQIEQSKVPSYGPEARRLVRKQRRQARSTT